MENEKATDNKMGYNGIEGNYTRISVCRCEYLIARCVSVA